MKANLVFLQPYSKSTCKWIALEGVEVLINEGLRNVEQTTKLTSS